MSTRPIKPWRARFAGTLLASLLLSSPARAEDLVQVLDLARTHDAAWQAAQAQARAAAPRAAQARAALRPNVTATASSNWSRYDPAASDADPTGARVDTRVTSISVNLRQALYNRAAAVDVDLAEAALASARIDLDISDQEFILKVAQAYFDVLAAQDLLATKQQSRASFGDQLKWARSRFQVGLGIITDQQDAQARFDLAEAEVVVADNDLRVRRLALERLTGRPGITPKPLAVPPQPLPMAPADLDSWLRDAAQHPAVRRAQLALDKARLDTRRAQAGASPTVDLVGSMAASRTGGGASAFSPGPPSRALNTSVGVEVNMPLFSGHARQNRLAETLILEEQAAHSLQAAVQATAEAVERAYFDVQSSQAQVRALQAAEASSRAALEGTQLGNRSGVRLNLDVLNAQSQLFQTRSDLAKARHEALMRSLRLTAAAGLLQPDSLQAINRLLAP